MLGANAIVTSQFVIASLAVTLGIIYIFVVGSARSRAIRVAAIPVTLLFLSAVVWGKIYAHQQASISTEDIASNPARAIESLTQALRADPTSSLAYLKRGIAYLKSNSPQRAYSDLENATELSPANRVISVEFAKATAAIGNTDKARTIVDAVLAKDPRDFDALNARGIIDTIEKNYLDAIKEFEAALAVSDDNTKRFIANANISLPLMGVKRFDDSLSHLESALGLRPNDSQILAAIANTYGQKAFRGDGAIFHQEALKMADRALAIDPNQTLAHITRCAALFYLGQKDLAIKELSALIIEHPDDPELLVMRAGMYTSTHQDELAKHDVLQSQIAISSSVTRGSIRNGIQIW